MLAIRHREFEVSFLRGALIGDRRTPAGSTQSVLLLHGGGKSCAAGFDELRAHLHAHRVETLAFDCIGHGRTGGAQIGSTLHQRVQQVQAVIRSEGLDPSRLTLAGFSMGAYVAAKTTLDVPVAQLCLAIPAAYAAHAYTVPFGPAFSEILRTPGSWVASDAFDAVDRYPGHLLVISAEADQVVPQDIPRRYAARRGGASTVHHVVGGSRHQLSEHYAVDPKAQAAAYAEIAALCLRGTDSPARSAHAK